MFRLPIDKRGYPVPWFVGWVDGEPEFRAVDPVKWVKAVQHKLCWVCGGPLGTYQAFVLGPMCTITRTSGEPPSHRDCAEWSVKNCPFLVRPHARRRENDLPEGYQDPNGIFIKRNPGVSALWVTRTYKLFKDDNGNPLVEVGDQLEVTWWAEGRPATREEVAASVESGLPELRKLADEEGENSIKALNKQIALAMTLLPKGTELDLLTP
jgi:hypothetical protein